MKIVLSLVLSAVITTPLLYWAWTFDNASRDRYMKKVIRTDVAYEQFAFAIQAKLNICDHAGDTLLVYTAANPSPLKCGKYEHVEPESMGCSVMGYVASCDTVLPAHCAPDIHEVTEYEWSVIVQEQEEFKKSIINLSDQVILLRRELDKLRSR